MASASKPTLKIKNSETLIGGFDATVDWTASWDAFDQASGQPYTVDVMLFGDDAGVPGDTQPGDDAVASKTYTLVPNGNTTPRSDKVTEIPYSKMNEDKAPETNPNPDEIRAWVRLSPQAAKVANSPESDYVTLLLG